MDEVQSDVYLFHDEELWFMEAIQSQGVASGTEPAHVRLRKARREAGLSQNEVARRLGMDVLSIAGLRAGLGRQDSTICRIMLILKVNRVSGHQLFLSHDVADAMG